MQSPSRPALQDSSARLVSRSPPHRRARHALAPRRRSDRIRLMSQSPVPPYNSRPFMAIRTRDRKRPRQGCGRSRPSRASTFASSGRSNRARRLSSSVALQLAKAAGSKPREIAQARCRSHAKAIVAVRSSREPARKLRSRAGLHQRPPQEPRQSSSIIRGRFSSRCQASVTRTTAQARKSAGRIRVGQSDRAAARRPRPAGGARRRASRRCSRRRATR